VTSPRFSFVVPTYARPEYLAEALKSIRAQTVEDWECVVVDDGSPMPPKIPPDERFRLVLREKNGGPAAARNSGLQVARGDVIVFLDDDDLVVPERLEIAEIGLRKAPVALCWGGTMGSPKKIRQQIWNGDVSTTILWATTPSLGQAAVWRSEVPDFDERYLGAEDVEWWLRVALACELVTVPAVGWLWRRHTKARGLSSIRARAEGRELMLEESHSYFSGNPRAWAFQMKRLGLQRLSLGDRRGAGTAFLKSLRTQPSLRTAINLGRILVSSSRRHQK
jgi:glycosyltransferase involved in cell wall biosynthesis